MCTNPGATIFAHPRGSWSCGAALSDTSQELPTSPLELTVNFITVGVAVVVLASFLCVCVLCGQGAVRVQRSVSLTNTLYRGEIYRAKTHGKDIRERQWRPCWSGASKKHHFEGDFELAFGDVGQKSESHETCTGVSGCHMELILKSFKNEAKIHEKVIPGTP